MKRFIENFSDEYLRLLSRHLLFSGLSEHEIFMFIQFSQPYYDVLHQGRSMQISGAYSHMICLAVTGSIYLYSVDYEGNKTLLKSLGAIGDGGAVYSMFDYYNSLLELQAHEDSEIILIPPEKLFIADEKLAIIQQKIVVNLIASQRQMLLDITEHLSCLTQRSIKDKILKFLKINCEKEHSYSFTVPYSREELANYLAVDRASLSRSLSELKKDGIIDYYKNRFKILAVNAFKF